MAGSTRASSSMPDAVVERRHAGAAVLLGVLNAQQPEHRQLRHQVGGKMLRLIPFANVRADLGFGELTYRAAQQLLLFGPVGNP